MRPSARRPPILRGLLAVVVATVAVLGGWWAGVARPDGRPPMTAALDAMPADTSSFGFTDWSAIRARGGTADAAVRDVSTRSVLVDEATGKALGFTVADDADWEAYGAGSGGGVAVVRLRGGVSFDAVEDHLRDTGYRRAGPTWRLDSATLRTSGLSAVQAVVSLQKRDRLVLLGAAPDGVARVTDVLDGRARSLAGVQAAAHTAEALAGQDAVLLRSGRGGCEDAAVDDDAEVRRQASAAERRAGGLVPYLFSGRAIRDDGGSGFGAQQVTFAMTFGDAATATEQSQVRRRLTSGPFIGRQGPVSDALRRVRVHTDGSTLRMGFAHDPDSDVLMTGLGPVLFAAC